MNHNNYFFKLYHHSRLAKTIEFIESLNKKNAVFIWIPKCAGTSLSNSLQCKKYSNLFNIKFKFPSKGNVTFGHIDYFQLYKNKYISSSFHKSSFKFAISRNPYDRAVSLFKYSQKTNIIPNDITFLDFCRILNLQKIEPIGLYNSRGLSQCNPQIRWIEKIQLDYIGKFENLEKDAQQIFTALNIPYKNLPHLNASNDIHYEKYYNAESKAIIQEVYKEDFEYFKYPL